jgi:hypothetical protein
MPCSEPVNWRKNVQEFSFVHFTFQNTNLLFSNLPYNNQWVSLRVGEGMKKRGLVCVSKTQMPPRAGISLLKPPTLSK